MAAFGLRAISRILFGPLRREESLKAWMPALILVAIVAIVATSLELLPKTWLVALDKIPIKLTLLILCTILLVQLCVNVYSIFSHTKFQRVIVGLISTLLGTSTFLSVAAFAYPQINFARIKGVAKATIESSDENTTKKMDKKVDAIGLEASGESEKKDSGLDPLVAVTIIFVTMVIGNLFLANLYAKDTESERLSNIALRNIKAR